MCGRFSWLFGRGLEMDGWIDLEGTYAMVDAEHERWSFWRYELAGAP